MDHVMDLTHLGLADRKPCGILYCGASKEEGTQEGEDLSIWHVSSTGFFSFR